VGMAHSLAGRLDSAAGRCKSFPSAASLPRNSGKCSRVPRGVSAPFVTSEQAMSGSSCLLAERHDECLHKCTVAHPSLIT
jgi:hypothetical protein